MTRETGGAQRGRIGFSLSAPQTIPAARLPRFVLLSPFSRSSRFYHSSWLWSSRTVDQEDTLVFFFPDLDGKEFYDSLMRH